MRKKVFLLGIIFAVFVSLIDPYLMIFKLRDARFTFQYWSPAAIFVLFFLTVLSCLHRRLELSSSELLFVFIMAASASVLPSLNFMTPLLTILTGFRYFANPANRWLEIFVEKTPSAVMVQDEQALRYFYEGLPRGEPIPFLAWLPPLTFFLVFMLIFAFLSICLMVLFRKQWMEKERLIYPLMILPLEMVRREGKSRVPILFKNKLFWLGAVLVFSYYFINWLSIAASGTAAFKLIGRIFLMRYSVRLATRTHFPIIGLSYFLPCSVSLSFWLFFFLMAIQNGFLTLSGFRLPGVNEIGGGTTAVSSFQCAGAMLALVFALVWRARKHLKECFCKAFNRSCAVDDGEEILSYRTAVFGLIISFLLVLAFMRYFGMSWFVSFFFLFFTLAVFLGLTRIVCQTGLPAAQEACSPSAYTSYLLPPGIISHQGYVALGLQYTWTTNVTNSAMASAAHALKVQEQAMIPRRLIFAGIITAIIVSYIASAWMHIYAGYRVGAMNVAYSGPFYGQFFFKGSMANYIDTFVVSKINTPLSREIIFSRYLFTALGVFIMGILMFFHSKFLWWPIHYIGFPIADSDALRVYWFSIFIAWLIKKSILRFGGNNVYRKSIPFFLGIIMGHIIWVSTEVVLNLAFQKTISTGWFAR